MVELSHKTNQEYFEVEVEIGQSESTVTSNTGDSGQVIFREQVIAKEDEVLQNTSKEIGKDENCSPVEDLIFIEANLHQIENIVERAP